MYSESHRRAALAVVASAESLVQASRLTGVSRATLRAWAADPSWSPRTRGCPRCAGTAVDGAHYAALLGFYLGDGCISCHRRHTALRVSCDAAYPAVIDDVSACMAAIKPSASICHVRAPGCLVVKGYWKHWPCLFPQHGPGRKHERPIELEQWQRRIVEAHPAPFLRGLFHSDGCRSKNWTRKKIAGEWKRYDYPRWQLTNHSADILALCGSALDLVEVAWRPSNWHTISVSRREAVARLDSLIGLKS